MFHCTELHKVNGDELTPGWLLNNNDFNVFICIPAVPVEVIDAVRLVNGQTCCDGRLEVLSGGQWKQACSVNSDVFDLNLARVVCRQLGCSTIGAAKSKIHL